MIKEIIISKMRTSIFEKLVHPNRLYFVIPTAVSEDIKNKIKKANKPKVDLKVPKMVISKKEQEIERKSKEKKRKRRQKRKRKKRKKDKLFQKIF